MGHSIAIMTAEEKRVLTSLSALCLMDLLKCPEPVKCNRVRGNWL